jgi:fido (protein-threonine AMPylation protein)
LSTPGARDGDTTSWFASFWEFCTKYCEQRFAAEWHLSPEQSLLLHGEQSVVPKQVIVCSPKGTNNKIELPFGTSLYDLKQPQMPPAHELVLRDGLRLFSNGAALVRASETLFKTNPIEARVSLESIRDASEVLSGLLDAGRSTVAGRLAGAFRHIHRASIADEILVTMKIAGYDVRETNPFTSRAFDGPVPSVSSPIVTRLQTLWELARPIVLEVFPKSPGLPRAKAAYLKSVDDIYHTDAYNSLSIEGYNVTPELIERVRSGDWNPDSDQADRQQRDALAARGYWQAFQIVKATLADIIAGVNAGELTRTSHRDWYRELFAPCAVAGLIRMTDLAGYRSNAVYLRNSRHVPPRWEVVRDAMPTLFDLLENETSPAVRAVLGHWLFGYIHPYPDGNGRVARFLMNAMLASGGYPWTVIRLEDRGTYLSALDTASVDANIRPFAAFIARSMKRKP